MINFKSGTALARQQDLCLARINFGMSQPINELKNMEDNLWVATAFKLAPSNLVIRHYCIIDIIKNSCDHFDEIFEMVLKLSYDERFSSVDRIWAEGYSYYEYTLNALNIWIKTFEKKISANIIKLLLVCIDNGFVNTAYQRDGVWYPAPFGDLSDEPLRKDLQRGVNHGNTKISSDKFNLFCGKNITSFNYVIKACPIGMNTHVPKDSYNVNIVEGIPVGFKFYEGYNKKYKNKFDELLDIFNLKRILSNKL
jgi:hypothetical protein